MLLATIHAVNAAGRSTNPIHFDHAAKGLGLRGAWVGGPTLLGYLARAALEEWGPDWLASGGINTRFRAPVYDKDVLRLEVGPREPGSAGPIAQLINSDDTACATAELIPPGAADPPAAEPDHWPEPADQHKPVITYDVLKTLPVLTSITFRPDSDDADTASGRHVTPERLVGASIEIMYATFRPNGPRILTGISTRHFAPVQFGQPLRARGRIVRAWRHKDRTYATNGVLISTLDEQPVMQIANSTIWEMPA